jgi:hypothetical protein
MSIHAAGADFYTDGGAANAYVLSPSGSFLAPEAYFVGMSVRFIPTNTNTGASTINVDGLGVKNIKQKNGSSDPEASQIVSGEKVDLVYDGTDFRLSENAIGRARVYLTLNQTIASGVYVPIPFEAEIFDVGGFHDNVTNNTRLTVPRSGVYAVSAQYRFEQNATGTRESRIKLNGISDLTTKVHPNSGGTDPLTEMDYVLMELTAGDYVELYLRQNSGGNLDVASGSNDTFFSIVELR